MKDIELAKKILFDEDMAIAIVKKDKCIYKSKKRGIYPLYIAVTEIKDELDGASVADRVIGRGAAQLYAYTEVKHVYARMISDGTEEIFKDCSIDYEAELTVPYIKNRDKTGMCPIETISDESENFEELLKKIKEFLRSENLL